LTAFINPSILLSNVFLSLFFIVLVTIGVTIRAIIPIMIMTASSSIKVKALFSKPPPPVAMCYFIHFPLPLYSSSFYQTIFFCFYFVTILLQIFTYKKVFDKVNDTTIKIQES